MHVLLCVCASCHSNTLCMCYCVCASVTHYACVTVCVRLVTVTHYACVTVCVRLVTVTHYACVTVCVCVLEHNQLLTENNNLFPSAFIDERLEQIVGHREHLWSCQEVQRLTLMSISVW